MSILILPTRNGIPVNYNDINAMNAPELLMLPENMENVDVVVFLLKYIGLCAGLERNKIPRDIYILPQEIINKMIKIIRENNIVPINNTEIIGDPVNY
jgi:hypothetical protein